MAIVPPPPHAATAPQGLADPFNYEEAELFIHLLEPTGKVTFQTFHDSDKTQTQCAKVLYGTLKAMAPKLMTLQDAGAGVFVTVNHSGKDKRAAADITRLRAVWMDLDNRPADAPPPTAADYPLEPSILVESSAGKYQLYWLLEPDHGMSAEEHKAIELGMVDTHGHDSQACDVARVLRLPGSLHQKGTPRVVRLQAMGGAKYSAEQIRQAFPPKASQPKPDRAPTAQTHPPITDADVVAMLACINPDDRDVWLKMAFALSTWEGDGFAVWDTWSQRSDKYDADQQAKTWESIKGKPQGVTMGTLVHMAIEGGYRQPAPGAADLFEVLPPAPEEDWPEPQPVNQSLLPVPAFDPCAMLPPSLAEYVVCSSHNANYPPEQVAVLLLSAIGSLIGNSHGLQLKRNDTWTVYPNLWAILVQPPGSKKSAAFNHATAGLRALEKINAERIRVTVELSELQTKTAEAAVKGIEKKLIELKTRKATMRDMIKADAKEYGDYETAFDVLESALSTAQMSVPKQIKAARYVVDDATPEKLLMLLEDNPSGVMVLRDEMGGFLAGLAREEKLSLRELILTLWQGAESRSDDRVGREGSHVERACATLAGSIQPAKLASLFRHYIEEEANDGLLQRFQLMLYPDPIADELKDDALDYDSEDVGLVIHQLDKACKNQPVRFIKLDDDAYSVYVRFHEWQTAQIKAAENGLLKEHFAKYPKLFGGLILIFSAYRCPIEPSAFPARGAEAELALKWCQYLAEHAKRCYGLAFSGGGMAAVALAEKIKSGSLQDGFTARDVERKGWENLGNRETITRALEHLMEADWLECRRENGGKRGRPLLRFYRNPRL